MFSSHLFLDICERTFTECPKNRLTHSALAANSSECDAVENAEGHIDATRREILRPIQRFSFLRLILKGHCGAQNFGVLRNMLQTNVPFVILVSHLTHTTNSYLSSKIQISGEYSRRIQP